MPPARRSTWWIVPLVIVGLVIIAWVLLAVLPVDRQEEQAETRPASETIAEGTTTGQGQPMSGTLIEVPGVEEPETTETTAPPLQDTTATMAPMSPTPIPAPAPAPAPAPSPVPAPVRPVRPVPAPVPPPTQTTAPPAPTPRPITPAPRPLPPTPAPARPPAAEITEGEAGSTLRGYITSRNYYDGVTGDCLSIRGQGYSNAGYTFAVWDGCVSGGGSRRLGRWRVDSKTREVFRQREDGRFLRP